MRNRFLAFRFLLFLYFCFLTLMLLHPDPWTLFGFPPMVIDLASHFSLLHCSVFAALSLGTESLRRKYSAGFWLTLLLLFGLVSEILQTQTGRCFENIDLFQNTLGLLVGFVVARFLKNVYWFAYILGIQTSSRQENVDNDVS